MRKIFSVNGGNMGTPGSVMYMFEKKGLIGVPIALLPEIAGKLNRVMDSYLSPRTTGTFLSDDDRAADAPMGVRPARRGR